MTSTKNTTIDGGRHGRWRSRRQPIRDLLGQQVAFALEGVELARSVCAGNVDAQDARIDMAGVEHAGDRARALLVDRMSTSLTTPLDREDLFRASRSLDDVLDNLRDLVREVALWEVPTDTWLADALEPIAESLRQLGLAAATRDLRDARAVCLAARKDAGRVRRCYQDGLARVFAGELTMATLKQREVLRRLDVVGLRLTEAADAILDGLVKRST